MVESARKGMEVKAAAHAREAKDLYEREIVRTLDDLDRVADDLLGPQPVAETTRSEDRRERVVRSALDRHAEACSRLLDLIDGLDSHPFVDPIRIIETDLRAR